MDLGDGIALLALVVAGWSALRQVGMQGEVTKIQKEQHKAALDAQERADVIGWFDSRAKQDKRQPCIYVMNKGPAEALNVDVRVPEIGAGDIIGREALPLPVMGPGQKQHFDVLHWKEDRHDAYVMALSWEDGTGQREARFSFVLP